MASKYDPRIRLVDVSARAREVLGEKVAQDVGAITGRAMPEQDWRFEIDMPNGGTCIFPRYATAEYVVDRVAENKTEARA